MRIQKIIQFIIFLLCNLQILLQDIRLKRLYYKIRSKQPTVRVSYVCPTKFVGLLGIDDEGDDDEGSEDREQKNRQYDVTRCVSTGKNNNFIK